jgi:hypothetical protein
MDTEMSVGQRVAWQRAIDNYTEQLVLAAEATLTDERMGRLKGKMRTAQLSNFLGVTLETNSVAAIANWVRYQMGRKETKEAWQTGDFGREVLGHIDKMYGWAKEIANREFGGAEASQHYVLPTHVALVRLYAGYLKRCFVARGGQDDKER